MKIDSGSCASAEASVARGARNDSSKENPREKYCRRKTNMLVHYLFYFLSFLAILCAIMVVATRKPVHSVIYLILTFFAIAGHYILLNAQFLAAVHIIVYAGAIMVLFLFVLMFLNLNSDSEPQKSNWLKIAGAVSSGLLLVVMTGAIKNTQTIPETGIVENNLGLVENLGLVLFSDFLLPFEVSSILFLTAIIGVIVLGKKLN